MEECLKNDTIVELEKCTRVEVIDDTGRAYVNIHIDNVVSISLQDDRRTLKVFIKKEPINLAKELKKEVRKLNKMTEQKYNNICSIDSIREQQSIVDDLIDKF